MISLGSKTSQPTDLVLLSANEWRIELNRWGFPFQNKWIQCCRVPVLSRHCVFTGARKCWLLGIEMVKTTLFQKTIGSFTGAKCSISCSSLFTAFSLLLLRVGCLPSCFWRSFRAGSDRGTPTKLLHRTFDWGICLGPLQLLLRPVANIL